MADLSDLLTQFLSLPFPRMARYGVERASLTYLPGSVRHPGRDVGVERRFHARVRPAEVPWTRT